MTTAMTQATVAHGVDDTATYDLDPTPPKQRNTRFTTSFDFTRPGFLTPSVPKQYPTQTLPSKRKLELKRPLPFSALDDEYDFFFDTTTPNLANLNGWKSLFNQAIRQLG